jgi:nucleolar protein 58
MRVKEWYGWHFPEMAKIVADNVVFSKVVKAMGLRTNFAATEFSGILDDETEAELKDAVQISMGTEVTPPPMSVTAKDH